MSYPVKKYTLNGITKTIDNVQLSLSSFFNTPNGKKIIDLLVKEYFSQTANTAEDLWRLDGIRSFVQMIIDTHLVLDNCTLHNINEEQNGR